MSQQDIKKSESGLVPVPEDPWLNIFGVCPIPALSPEGEGDVADR
ncbi:hypothetical protein [Cesiribacter sp. SM1]|nr:hypothetical protein [Cesiribacter sp. SM1]